MGIVDVIRGKLPPAIAEAKNRAYHRDYMRSRPDLRERNLARKNKKYREDEEYREKRKAAERARGAAMTKEQRAEIYLKRKLHLATLPEEEYLQQQQKKNARSRKWRARKKKEREDAAKSAQDLIRRESEIDCKLEEKDGRQRGDTLG